MTHGLVRRSAGGDGTLWAAVTRVGGIEDDDLILGRSIGSLGVRSSKCWEEESSEFGVHVGWLMSKVLRAKRGDEREEDC